MYFTYKTVRIRLKDASCSKELVRMSRAVNYVWNYCNETSFYAIRYNRKWLTGFDLNKLTSGSCRELGIASSTIQEVGERYAKNRMIMKKRKLRWRGRKSLGWVPFKKDSIKLIEDGIVFRGKFYRVFQPDRLPKKEESGAGEFCQDSRGRWYLCISVKVPKIESSATKAVGIDLGVKTVATLSDGQKVENHRYFRMMERRLAKAQQAKKKRRVQTLHAKIKNQRQDTLHKASTQIANENALIVVGNLNIEAFMQTKVAKSLADSAPGKFRYMLKYKAKAREHLYVEVNEAFTTRTCSSCGIVPDSAPKGVKGLSIREWVCSNCGSVHDRDVNAALNILRLGHQSLASKGN